jgi:glycosyltransferase involved in cell wall biosynthesis
MKHLMFADGLRCLRDLPASYSADNLYPHDAADAAHDIRMVQGIVDNVRAVTVASWAAEALFRDTYCVPTNTRIFHVPHRHYIGKYPDLITKERARAHLTIPPSAKLVLSLGRITPYKGLPSLVRAFLAADTTDSILLIAGSEKVPGTVAAIRREAAAAGRPDAVVIHDRFIPDVEIQNYMRASDVMALAYEDVPMNPGSVILAMSFGLPVICVNEGSVPEILGPCLFPYRRGDFLDQTRAIRDALSNPELLVYLGKEARFRAETSHSPEMVAAGLRRCFDYVLA